MKKTEKILWDIDTQNDLILRGRVFAIPGAYRMAKNFGLAIKYFDRLYIPIMGVVDAHVGHESVTKTRDENLPLHCIKGTSGQLKIKETQGDILYVSDHKYDEEALDLIVEEIKSGKRVYFEKQCQWAESNPNIVLILKKLRVKKVYMIGVLTNVCVRYSDKMFKKLGIKTYLVLDALKGNDFPGDTEESAIKEMLSTGSEIFRYKQQKKHDSYK